MRPPSIVISSLPPLLNSNTPNIWPDANSFVAPRNVSRTATVLRHPSPNKTKQHNMPMASRKPLCLRRGRFLTVPPDQTFSLSPSEGERVGERGPFARFWWYGQEAPPFLLSHSPILRHPRGNPGKHFGLSPGERTWIAPIVNFAPACEKGGT